MMMILTGILYPLVITAVTHLFFPHQANGSMVMVDGEIRGSKLVGQKFVNGRYFWSRPSAIDYDPMPSGASNLGPTSTVLRETVQKRRIQIENSDTLISNTNIPIELLFTSASGIDPHISPEAARMQIDRIAQTRGFTLEQKEKLENLVEHSIEPPQWIILGEQRVNVFLLNVALDQLN